MIDPDSLKKEAEKSAPSTRQMIKRLKKKPPARLDDIAQTHHHAVFSELDCLDCANCCKSISPILYNKDIERLADGMRMKPSDFMEKYIRTDEDGDFVFKQTPCPFLMNDNYCSEYANRPKACREYPHTDRARFYQLLDLTLKNTYFCPAAYYVMEELKKSGL